MNIHVPKYILTVIGLFIYCSNNAQSFTNYFIGNDQDNFACPGDWSCGSVYHYPLSSYLDNPCEDRYVCCGDFFDGFCMFIGNLIGGGPGGEGEEGGEGEGEVVDE